MPILTWRARKKLFFSFLVLAACVAIFLILYFIYRPEATCFDGRENQGEEGVDCGGPCQKCVVNPSNLVVLWSRAFEISDGVYDVAALVENPNLLYGMPLFKYTFKIYSPTSVLLAIKEGNSFFNPAEKFVLVATGIKVDKEEVFRSFVEIEYLSDWQYTGEKKSSITVSGKDFTNSPFASLRAKLTNSNIFTLKDVQLSVVLYNNEGNAVGVSSSKLSSIIGEGSEEVVFTWPWPFEKEPSSSQIFARVYLLDNE